MIDTYAKKALENEISKLATTATGGRNHALNTAAFSLGQFVEAGRLSDVDVREALLDAATRNGLLKDDGLHSVTATINSGMTAAELKPREHFETDATVGTLILDADKINQFWDSRPVLKHIQQFAYARMTAPWAVLGGCLLRAIAHLPPHYTLPPIIGGRGSANLLVALVGASGAGKGASEAAAREALTWQNVTVAPLGSGEGITHTYGKALRQPVPPGDNSDPLLSDCGTFQWRTKSILFAAPEVDQIGAISGRKGSTLMGQLRSAYSGEILGFSYADETRKIVLPAHSYRFGLSVGVQPGRATILLDDSDGGTPQRFLWLPVTDTNISIDPPPQPAQWKWTPAMPYQQPGDPHDGGFVTIPVPDEAVHAMREAHVSRAQGKGDALDGHSLYTRLKTAVGLMMLDQRISVSVEDWELAGIVMMMSDHTRTRIQKDLEAKAEIAGFSRAKRDARNQMAGEDEIASQSVQRVAKKLERRFGTQTRFGLSELRRTLSSRDRIWFEDAVQFLVENGGFRRSDSTSNFGSGGGLERV